MRPPIYKTALSLTVFALAGLFAATTFLPADANAASRYKIKCKDHYQLVQGNWISTTPCEEEYIAKVARSYGYKVTVSQIRNNPNKKAYVCQQLGHDTRISNICGAYGDQDRSLGR